MAHHIPKISYGGLIPTVITLEYPPSKDDGESYDVVERVQTSVSGVRQVQVDYTEANRPIVLSSVSPALKTALETFFLNHARYGKAFRYYEDQNSASYVEYELKDLKFNPKRVGIRGENLFAWEIPLALRRVGGVTRAEDYVQQDILNNQSSPLDIEGLLLNSATYKSVKIFFEVFRKTSASEIVANGFLTATYKTGTGSWDITPEGTFDGDNHGLTFSVSAAGQVKYVSSNMSGTGYGGKILLRNFTIVEG